MCWARNSCNGLSNATKKCIDTVGDPKQTQTYTRIKSILDSKDKIPHAYRIGNGADSQYYNFWQDEQHVQGIWRRTSLESYKSKDPQWTTVLDLDALPPPTTGTAKPWVEFADSPGVKGEKRAREKMANDYEGHANQLKDLARLTLRFNDPRNLVTGYHALSDLGYDIVVVKNKYKSPTPMGYSDLNLVVAVKLRDGTPYLCEMQLNLIAMLDAKNEAHEHYEIIRSKLPELCRGTPVDADKLESFISGRLNNSALDSAVAALSLRADGLFLYAHLLAEHLERAGGEIDFGALDALPAGLGEVYATNFLRAFPRGADDDGWAAALPLVELVAAAPEPIKVETAKAMLGITGDARVFELTSLFFPVRDDLIHVLHKTVRKEEGDVRWRILTLVSFLAAL